MARIVAQYGIDIDQLNLHEPIELGAKETFLDGRNTVLNGTTYADFLRFTLPGGAGYVGFLGPDLQVDPDGALVGGTVTAIVQTLRFPGEGLLTVAAEGLALSGAAVGAAILSPGLADDRAILREAFSGDDQFRLSPDADLMRGFDGQDSIRGGAGADRLFGGDGDDTLKGQGQNDWLYGQGGGDTLAGGKGSDTFVFASPDEGPDSVQDFHGRQGAGDLIALDRSGFGGGLRGDHLRDGQFQSGPAHEARDAGVRVIFDTTDTTLWWDRNGDKAGGLVLIADLQDGARVTADDIVLV